MSETLAPVESIVEQNEALLRSAPAYGPELLEAYETALTVDAGINETVIVGAPQDNARVAFASPAWANNQPGGMPDASHRVHIHLEDQREIHGRFNALMQAHPDLVSATSAMLGISAERLTPQLFYVFSFLHELGHTAEFAVHSANPHHFRQQRSAQRAMLPVPNVAPSSLADPSSDARRQVVRDWKQVQARTGVSDIDELVAAQTRAYRSLPSEKHADQFAVEVLRHRRPELLHRLVL